MHNAIETNGSVFTPYLVDERAPYADALFAEVLLEATVVTNGKFYTINSRRNYL